MDKSPGAQDELAAAKKQLTGEKPELKNALANIYEDFKIARETQMILHTARNPDEKTLTEYFFKIFDKAYKEVQGNPGLADTEIDERIRQIDALKAKWLGSNDKKGEKGQFYGELAPFMRQGDIRNRASVLAKLHDGVNAIVNGGHATKNNTDVLMAFLKETPLSMAKRRLDSLQYYAGGTKEDAKNWPSDTGKAKAAKEAYAAFEKQAKYVYALRTGKVKPGKEAETLPIKESSPAKTAPTLIAKAKPEPPEGAKRDGRKKAA